MIVSKNNAKVKELENLKKSKQYFFLDTEKLVAEALNANLVQVAVVCSDVAKFSSILSKCSANVIETNQSVLKSLSSVESPSGIIGIFEKKHYELNAPKRNFLVLDKVQDPGNVGTLIRSAFATDFEYVVGIESALPTNDKVIRSAMGCLFKLPYITVSENEFIEFAQKNRLNLACADMYGENVFSSGGLEKLGLIVGSEGQGVRKSLKDLCTKTLTIPMKNGLESLNAGVSGSIIMYQISKGEML